MKEIVKKNILGIEVSDMSVKDVLEYIFTGLEKGSDPYYIVTPNPEMIVRAQHDAEFKTILNNARLSLCDGVGLYLAAKVLGKEVDERIPGVDLMELICKESVRKAVSIGFLGGKGSVAQRSAECLREKYPGLIISFVSEEWSLDGFEKGQERGGEKSQNIQEIDILFVAFGFPKQEKWMAGNVGKLPFRVAIGVGGAFDYFSGDVKRAPNILRTLGLEWLYRLVRQPWRWKRQLALLQFAGLAVREKLLK